MEKRWGTHVSKLKSGTHHANIQAVHTTVDDWEISLLESVSTELLDEMELQYITQHINNPLCLNARTSIANGRRNQTISNNGRHNQALALLGKNTTEGIRRPTNLTFISPSGKEYTNIVSVNSFAAEHNLAQPAMNMLANNEFDSVYGWTVKDYALPSVGHVLHYWPEERLQQHYPQYTIIGPDETIYKSFSLYDFNMQHNCSVITHTSSTGARLSIKGINNVGQGYRLDSVKTFTVTYENKVYTNVVSLSRLALTLNIHPLRFANLVNGKRTVKNKRKYSITTN
jgi:hypothetical protein